MSSDDRPASAFWRSFYTEQQWWHSVVGVIGIFGLYIGLGWIGNEISQWHSEDKKVPELSMSDLLDWCSPFESLDTSRMIVFNIKDHSIRLSEAVGQEAAAGALGAKNPRISMGTWRADENIKAIYLNISGEEKAYTLTEPNKWESCILVAGPIKSADLSQSWFGTTDSGGH